MSNSNISKKKIQSNPTTFVAYTTFETICCRRLCDRILKRLFRVVHWVLHVKSVIQSHVLPNRFYIDTDYIVNSLWLILTVLFWSQNVTNLVLCTHDDFAALELMHTQAQKNSQKKRIERSKPNQSKPKRTVVELALRCCIMLRNQFT